MATHRSAGPQRKGAARPGSATAGLTAKLVNLPSKGAGSTGAGRRAASVDIGPRPHRTRPTARRQLERTPSETDFQTTRGEAFPRRGWHQTHRILSPGPSSGCGSGSRPASSPDNRRVLYPEWRRDRPVDATTTYRRDVGKVPSPGRSSCEIRDTPFGAPSKRPGRPVHRPRPRRLSTIRSCLCRTEPCRRLIVRP